MIVEEMAERLKTTSKTITFVVLMLMISWLAFRVILGPGIFQTSKVSTLLKLFNHKNMWRNSNTAEMQTQMKSTKVLTLSSVCKKNYCNCYCLTISGTTQHCEYIH